MLLSLITKAVEAALSSHDGYPEAVEVQEQVQVLQAVVPSRFYPIQLHAPKEEDRFASVNGEKKERAAQIWIVRFPSSEAGRQADQAMQNLQAEGALQLLMDAEYREDRAPKGSMVRALEGALEKSIGKQKE